MEGVSIVPTETLQALISKVEQISEQFNQVTTELKEAKSPYLTTKEVCAYLKKSENWVLLHKHELGCSKRAGTLIFKRADLDEFIDQDYFKIPANV